MQKSNKPVLRFDNLPTHLVETYTNACLVQLENGSVQTVLFGDKRLQAIQPDEPNVAVSTVKGVEYET